MLTRKQPPPRTNQPGPREPLPVHMGLIGPVAECLCKTGLRIHFWSGVTRAKTLVGTRSVLIITHRYVCEMKHAKHCWLKILQPRGAGPEIPYVASPR